MRDAIPPANRLTPIQLLVALGAFVLILTASVVYIVHYLLVEQSRSVVLHGVPVQGPQAPSSGDVTEQLRSKITGNSLSVVASAYNFGFPPGGATKTLRVEYTIDGSPGVRSAREDELLTITARPGKKLDIRKAEFGVLPPQKDTVAAGDIGPAAGTADVTRLVRQAVGVNGLTIKADNDTFGDPAGNQPKLLRVEYTLNGAPGVRLTQENQTLTILAERGQKLEIQKAIYGAGLVENNNPALGGGGVVDVSPMVQQAVQDNSLTITGGNAIFGDPAPGVFKRLRVEYTIDGSPGVRSSGENASLSIVAGLGKTLKIQRALYGDLPYQADQRAAGDVGVASAVGAADVTRLVRKAVAHNRLSITASNDALGGDPAYGVAKRLAVEYTVAGTSHTASSPEGKTLSILTDSDGEGLMVIVKAIWGVDQGPPATPNGPSR